jgi:hypothetical protein
MRRSDPEGVLLRSLQLTPISRRVYNVTCPLALWHLDGHHKLIRYVFKVPTLLSQSEPEVSETAA